MEEGPCGVFFTSTLVTCGFMYSICGSLVSVLGQQLRQPNEAHTQQLKSYTEILVNFFNCQYRHDNNRLQFLVDQNIPSSTSLLEPELSNINKKKTDLVPASNGMMSFRVGGLLKSRSPEWLQFTMPIAWKLPISIKKKDKQIKIMSMKLKFVNITQSYKIYITVQLNKIQMIFNALQPCVYNPCKHCPTILT